MNTSVPVGLASIARLFCTCIAHFMSQPERTVAFCGLCNNSGPGSSPYAGLSHLHVPPASVCLSVRLCDPDRYLLSPWRHQVEATCPCHALPVRRVWTNQLMDICFGGHSKLVLVVCVGKLVTHVSWTWLLLNYSCGPWPLVAEVFCLPDWAVTAMDHFASNSLLDCHVKLLYCCC